MWRTAFALVAVAGCNQVFGLVPGRAHDAAPVDDVQIIDAVMFPSSLTWSIAASGTTAISAPIGSEASRPELPVIRVGTLDGPLEDAVYDVGSGTFGIRYDIAVVPHRIVYTLPGDLVVHEVQLDVAEARLVVPRTTRLDAPAAPAGSGYRITPPFATWSSPILATSGVFTFTADPADFSISGQEVAMAFADTDPLRGPMGAPQPALGDWVLVGDWGDLGDSVEGIRAYAKTELALVAGSLSAPPTGEQPLWNNVVTTFNNSHCAPNPNPNPVLCWPGSGAGNAQTRLGGLLDSQPGTIQNLVEHGWSPSTALPPLVASTESGYLERPLTIPCGRRASASTLIKCADASLDSAANLGLERVAYQSYSRVREVEGVTLRSSLRVVARAPFPGSLVLAAPLATSITLGNVSLSGASDGVTVAAASATELSFGVETAFTAHDFVVTLFEIIGDQLVPRRRFHVLGTSVRIDPDVFGHAKTYVFSITARNGMPAAASGDFELVQYPFSTATVFGRTFVVY
jgi:hypothetical protein